MTGVFDRYWRHVVVATAIVQGPEGVVLVENHRGHGRTEWTLPGGILDPGETLLETACREVEEEAGLRVTAWGGYAFTVHRILEPVQIQVVVHAFAASAWEGEIVAHDPDGIVRDVEFTPRHAVERRMPDPAFHVPLLTWLDDRTPRLYEFGWSGQGPSTLL